LTLQWYLLRQLALSFAVALAGITFVILPAMLISAVHKLGGVSMLAVLGYLPLVAQNLVPYVLPVCFLLAVVATYGRLAQDQEWTAICMAGIHPLRSLIPAFAVALVLSGLTYWLFAAVSPHSGFAQRVYRQKAIVSAFRNLAPGRTEIEFGDFFLKGGRDGSSFVHALLQIPRGSEREAVRLVADRVDIWFEDDDIWVRVLRARVVDGKMDSRGDQWVERLPLADAFRPTPPSKLQARYMTSSEIVDALETGAIDPKRRHTYEFEVEQRKALASVYLMFVLLGAPTGLVLRRGTLLAALATAVLYALVFYVLYIRASKELALHQAIPAVAAAWIVPALGAGLGAWMCWRVLRR
jgi:lipopolysaccharide export system permease protein